MAYGKGGVILKIVNKVLKACVCFFTVEQSIQEDEVVLIRRWKI